MNFKEQKEYVKNNKKIEMKHFNKVSEITNMIDFLNKEREDEANKRAGEEVSSISKFLERSYNRKMFFMKVKP